MRACVLDASVAVKWFLPPETEPLWPEALRVLDDYRCRRLDLIAPDLFWPELANVFRKAVRQRRLSPEGARRALTTLDETAIAPFPSRSLWKEAFDIATTFDRSVYDAVYVALAAARSIPLLTADERLANALAARFPIRWLGAW